MAAAAIFGIPDDGVADAGQLYSDLVAAAGAEFDGDETGCVAGTKQLIAQPGFPLPIGFFLDDIGSRIFGEP